MKLVKKGRKEKPWRGTCSGCGDQYTADRKELKVEYDQREGYEFAHKKCPNCKNDFVFYPQK
jgi:hypothetical protein